MRILLSLIVLGTLHSHAWSLAGDPPRQTLARPQALVSREPALETFIDGFLAPRLASQDVPGCVFVLVRGGQIVLAKGYGSETLPDGPPIDPSRTVFRVASISKLFTATALMQLVDQGLLDLERNVNDYLREFKIPNTYDEPVTARTLLSHVAGFDERYLSLHVRSQKDLVPLGAYLASELPPRCRPPGRLYHYSNHGTALAGYLVEAITGRAFSDFVREDIIHPLGMTSSDFELTPELSGRMARAYDDRWFSRKPVALTFANVGPAGGLNSTGMDMARFMLMHLALGELDGRKIITKASALEMQRRQFTHDPRISGNCLAFIESLDSGQRGLRHTGFAPGYVSLVYLVPDKDLGFFISSTSLNAFWIQYDLRYELMKYLFPRQETSPIVVDPIRDLAEYEGQYRFIRYPRATFDRLAATHSAFTPEITVLAEDPRHLMLHGLVPPSIRLEAIDQDLFRRLDGRGLVSFGPAPGNSDGSIEYLFMEHSTGPGAFHRLKWHQTRSFDHASWLIVSIGLLLGLFYLTVPCPVVDPSRRVLLLGTRRWIAGLNVTALTILYGPFITLFPLEGGFPQHTYGPSPLLVPLRYLSWIFPILVVFTIKRVAQINRIRSIPDRERWIPVLQLVCLLATLMLLFRACLIGLPV